MAERERSSERARQLLGYLRAKSGVEPLRGEFNSVSRFRDLLTEVNHATHTTCERAATIDLLDRTVNWFVRMFTMSDAQVRAILALATTRYTGSEQLNRLKAVVVTPHHLRLLFGGRSGRHRLRSDPTTDTTTNPMAAAGLILADFGAYCGSRKPRMGTM